MLAISKDGFEFQNIRTESVQKIIALAIRVTQSSVRVLTTSQVDQSVSALLTHNMKNFKKL